MRWRRPRWGVADGFCPVRRATLQSSDVPVFPGVAVHGSLRELSLDSRVPTRGGAFPEPWGWEVAGSHRDPLAAGPAPGWALAGEAHGDVAG